MEEKLLKTLRLRAPAGASTRAVLVTNTVLTSPTPPAQATQAIQKTVPGTFGLLMPAEVRALLRQIQQSPGGDILAASRVITLSGQQAQVQVVELKSVVTAGLGPGVNAPTVTAVPFQTVERKSMITPASGPGTNGLAVRSVPFGPSVDLIPVVQVDGRTIDLTAVPNLTEFLGYGDPGPFPELGESMPRPALSPLPRFRARHTAVRAAVPDGQTLVVIGFGDADPDRKEPRKKGKQIVILLTPSLVDAAGNAIHPQVE